MEGEVLVLFSFIGRTISLMVSSVLSFDEFKVLLSTKGVPNQTLLTNMFFTVPPFPECRLSNNEEWTNLMFLLKSTGTTVVTVRSENCVETGVQHTQCITTGSFVESGSNNTIPISIVTHDSNSLEVIESSGPQIDLPRVEKKNLLTAGWAYYIEGVGQKFLGGVIEFRNKLAKYSIEKGYKFKFIRNTKKQVIAECAKRKSHDCQWFINATHIKHNNWFHIRVFRGEHTCPMEVRSQKRLSASIIALLIVDKVKDNPSLNAPAVISMFQQDYGLNVSYKQAWRSIDKAQEYIYGNHIDSYQELKWNLYNLKQVNPGSHIEFESGPVTNPETRVTKNRFIRAFVAFQASIEGFAFCRPLLSIDGTFLSGRYTGILLAATAKDGDNGLFPVAFAIVSSENKENWKWFIEQLLKLIPASRDVIYVSDRNVGLISLFENEFSHLNHFYGLHHLKTNLRDRFKGKTFDQGYKESAANMLSECARAPTPVIFEQKLDDLKKYGLGIVNNFLQGLPFHKWAFAYAPCERFGEMTSNASESYNNWIKDARQLPITQCVDLIRSQTMEWFHVRRNRAANWSSLLCPVYKKKWDASLQESRGWQVRRSSIYVFEVLCYPTVTVNLQEKKCDCFKWQFSGFPCSHAVKALDISELAVEDYVDPYYLTSTYRKCYEGIIFPVSTMRKFTHHVDLGEKVYPPSTVRLPGRPTKKRIPSSGELSPKRQYRCSRCGQAGHTSPSCKEPLRG